MSIFDVVLLDRPWKPDPKVWGTEARRPQRAWPDAAVMRCAADVERRDARELRGEPPDMSGWLLFDGSAP